MPEPIAEAELVERVKRELREELLQSGAPLPGLGHNGGPPIVDQPVYDTLEFCAAHKISRSMLYELWHDGIGPRFYRIGTSIRITGEAAADWRREREKATDQKFAENSKTLESA